jgi:hypothetical protein
VNGDGSSGRHRNLEPVREGGMRAVLDLDPRQRPEDSGYRVAWRRFLENVRSFAHHQPPAVRRQEINQYQSGTGVRD